MNLPSSPFVVGRPLRPDEPIFGREDAFDFIHASLRQNASANLVGERRMGKTSLLRHLRGNPQHQPRDPDVLLAEVDLQANIATAADFYGRAMQALLAAPRAPANFPPAQTQAQFAEFEDLLRRLHGQGLRPVLLVDEFERLLEPRYAAGFPFPGFFDGLRSLIGANLLAMVVASRLTLAEHFERHPTALTSTFPSYLPPFILRELDDAAADSLLMQGLPCGIGIGEMQQARAWAGGHPCRLQCTGQAWYEAKNGRHDALWARRRFEELAGQACLLRKLPVPVGKTVKRVGSWLARLPAWVCMVLPIKIGGVAQWLGVNLGLLAKWILGLIVVLSVIAKLMGWDFDNLKEILMLAKKKLG